MVGEPGVSPRGPSSPTLCPASPSLQWVPGTGVPHLPDWVPLGSSLRYYDPLRLPIVRLGGVRFSLSSPDTLHHSSFFVSLSAERLVREAGASSQRRESFPLGGTPAPDSTQGDHWLSQVPESPLWMHAPLSDPGGSL